MTKVQCLSCLKTFSEEEQHTHFYEHLDIWNSLRKQALPVEDPFPLRYTYEKLREEQ